MSASKAATVAAQDTDAEESVLGACLLSSRAIESVEGILNPDDFYFESHGRIYSTILNMHEAGQPVDGITLADQLDKRGLLEDVGGRPKLAELVALCPATANVTHYAWIVREHAIRRKLTRVAFDLQRESHADPRVAMAAAEESIAKLSDLAVDEVEAAPMTTELSEKLSEIKMAFQSDKPILGELTGFIDLDNILFGFWAGQLIILAARPGQGKSALAQNIAENMVDRGKTVLLISLEMGRTELMVRSMARAARIDSRRIMTGQLRDMEEVNKLAAVLPIIRERNRLRIYDRGTITLGRLRAMVQKIQRDADLGLVVVDYIQLMGDDNASDNRNLEIGRLSRGLKLMARQTETPFLVISQMSRDIEKRANKRPLLSDLRDSGSLEQDADVVLFLHDESSLDPDKEPNGTTEVIVAKNRRGETGVAKLAWTKRWLRFQNLDRGGTNA